MAEEKTNLDPIEQRMKEVVQNGMPVSKAQSGTNDKPGGIINKTEGVLRQVGAVQDGDNREYTWTRGTAVTMGWSLLLFSAVVIGMATLLLWKRKVSGTQIVRLFLLALIVTLSCFLVIIGYSNTQLTPVIGLFGAICGYLLGRESQTPPEKNKESPAEEESS
jgi:hypothetical protein